jgi:hypothetical protein
MHLIENKNGVWLLDGYLQYLRDNATNLPPGARSFALAEWHYDFRHKQCPHDSWLEELRLTVVASGERRQQRSLLITSRYLGAYQDGHHHLTYEGVSSHSISLVGAGDDWIVDEITLAPEGGVRHKIVFAQGAMTIHCRDLSYRWEPKRGS